MTILSNNSRGESTWMRQSRENTRHVTVTWSLWLKTRKSWVVWVDGQIKTAFSVMSPQNFSLFLVFGVLNFRGFVESNLVNVIASESSENLKKVSYLSPPPPPGSAVANSPPVFKPDVGSAFLNLLSSFPEDLEMSEYCSELLLVFGQRYVTYVDCLVPAARPVKACQNCFSSYGSLVEIYTNISSDQVWAEDTSHFPCFTDVSWLSFHKSVFIYGQCHDQLSHELCDVTVRGARVCERNLRKQVFCFSLSISTQLYDGVWQDVLTYNQTKLRSLIICLDISNDILPTQMRVNWSI